MYSTHLGLWLPIAADDGSVWMGWVRIGWDDVGPDLLDLYVITPCALVFLGVFGFFLVCGLLAVFFLLIIARR